MANGNGRKGMPLGCLPLVKPRRPPKKGLTPNEMFCSLIDAQEDQINGHLAVYDIYVCFYALTCAASRHTIRSAWDTIERYFEANPDSDPPGPMTFKRPQQVVWVGIDGGQSGGMPKCSQRVPIDATPPCEGATAIGESLALHLGLYDTDPPKGEPLTSAPEANAVVRKHQGKRNAKSTKRRQGRHGRRQAGHGQSAADGVIKKTPKQIARLKIRWMDAFVSALIDRLNVRPSMPWVTFRSHGDDRVCVDMGDGNRFDTFEAMCTHMGCSQADMMTTIEGSIMRMLICDVLLDGPQGDADSMMDPRGTALNNRVLARLLAPETFGALAPLVARAMSRVAPWMTLPMDAVIGWFGADEQQAMREDLLGIWARTKQIAKRQARGIPMGVPITAKHTRQAMGDHMRSAIAHRFWRLAASNNNNNNGDPSQASCPLSLLLLSKD